MGAPVMLAWVGLGRLKIARILLLIVKPNLRVWNGVLSISKLCRIISAKILMNYRGRQMMLATEECTAKMPGNTSLIR
jgi:hypothetical protein